MRMRGKLPIFNYKDTWSLTHTLAPIISEGVKKFKDAVETSAFKGVPEGFDTVGEWVGVLDKIIFSFEECLEDASLPDEYWEGTEGMSLVEKLNMPKTSRMVEIWDEFVSQEMARKEKIQEGLDLFAKHFQDLWW